NRLKQIDQLKDQFLANTSHELRTPLNGIIGLTESLKDGAAGKLSKPAIENLDLIVQSGKRLSNLVNDILDFSKLKNRELELKIKAIDLHAVTDIVVKILSPMATEKSVKLINSISSELPLVEADENRLQQILFNLIGNAIKFTKAGEVEIKSAVAAGKMHIEVSDTGIGIPEEQFESIFNSFEQGDGSAAREYGGTGLGLSVTKQLVELHGGSIDVQSKVNEGSTFSFTLPLSSMDRSEISKNSIKADTLSKLSETASSDQNGSAEIPVVPASNRKILIVDDEPINRKVLENHLRIAGYQMEQARSGEETINRLTAEHGFDLILLDIMMPGLSGFEVCEKIRETYTASELPVIMLTAKNRVSDLVNGFNSGANDYLSKPFSKNELLSRLKTHLNLKGIHHATSKFVPTEFLKSVGREHITEVVLGDHVEKKVTVLFSDIREYTKIAEGMTPRQNFKFINSYVGKMGPVIKANNGFVNHYLGDGILALFPHTPQEALQSAIEMQKAIHKYNQQRVKDGYLPISVGMGLHTGPLIMGIIGDHLRNDTAIISDTVNAASRLEGITKFYGAQIILSEDSLKDIKDPEIFGLRFLGRVKVMGKEKSLGIYECFDGDKEEESIRLKKKSLKLFEKGTDLFMNGKFPKASAAFDKVLSQNPQDRVAKYFVSKSAEFTLSGFPDDWDVATSMDEK
ncbi:MAG: ATP-binding protein, partial [Flavobacteriaceae bacterium]